MDETSVIAAKVVDAFERVWRERMQALPILNPALSVEVVGLRPWRGRWLAALITPWSINLLLLPGSAEGGEDLGRVGVARQYDFPAGWFEFIGGTEAGLGPFEMCSLFSPAVQFASQDVAKAAALAALHELLTPHGAAESGAARAGENLAASASHKKTAAKLSRRDLFRGVFGRQESGAS